MLNMRNNNMIVIVIAFICWPLPFQVVFRQVDRNRSGTVERGEIFEALTALSFDIPKEAQDALFYRFAKQRLYMDFDDFVACCCRAEIMHSKYWPNELLWVCFGRYTTLCMSSLQL